jgi:hypothetical protein
MTFVFSECPFLVFDSVLEIHSKLHLSVKPKGQKQLWSLPLPWLLLERWAPHYYLSNSYLCFATNSMTKSSSEN